MAELSRDLIDGRHNVALSFGLGLEARAVAERAGGEDGAGPCPEVLGCEILA